MKPSAVTVGMHTGMQLSGLRWTNWGGSVATAKGTADAPAPGQPWAAATPHAITAKAVLGRCNGKPAYTTLSWTVDGYTAAQNAQLQLGTVNLCTVGQ